MTEGLSPFDTPVSNPPGAGFRPVVFGEALFDHFPDGARVLGGAPFNVAWHLRGFKADPLLVTAVGRDKEGEEILSRMGSWSMVTSGVQIHPTRPTGRVTARLMGDQPRFEIEARQAYDGISIQTLPPLPLPNSPAILYHGTLCLREETSRQTLDFIRNRLRLPRLVDVNLRDPWWSLEDVRHWIRGADWVKTNEEEAGLLSRHPATSRTEIQDAATALREELEIGTVVVTMGPEGALASTAEGILKVDGVQTRDIADTVGAGDAFSAVLTLGIQGEWPVRTTLLRGAEFAAEICRIRGATSPDTGLYTRTLRRWNRAS